MSMILIALILFGFSEYFQVVFCNHSTWQAMRNPNSDMAAYFATVARIILLILSYYCAMKGAGELK